MKVRRSRCYVRISSLDTDATAFFRTFCDFNTQRKFSFLAYGRRHTLACATQRRRRRLGRLQFWVFRARANLLAAV